MSLPLTQLPRIAYGALGVLFSIQAGRIAVTIYRSAQRTAGDEGDAYYWIGLIGLMLAPVCLVAALAVFFFRLAFRQNPPEPPHTG